MLKKPVLNHKEGLTQRTQFAFIYMRLMSTPCWCLLSMLVFILYKNLHLLWDAAFGIGAQKMIRPLSYKDEQWICETASSIEKMFPQKSLPESKNMDCLQWSKESYQLAVQVAYNGVQVGKTPSCDYLAIGEHTALRQIALSGYRLAKLINEIFNN